VFFFDSPIPPPLITEERGAKVMQGGFKKKEGFFIRRRIISSFGSKGGYPGSFRYPLRLRPLKLRPPIPDSRKGCKVRRASSGGKAKQERRGDKKNGRPKIVLFFFSTKGRISSFLLCSPPGDKEALRGIGNRSKNLFFFF
jgi:hypothetical protein